MDNDLYKVLGRMGWLALLKQLHENAPDSLIRTSLSHAVQYTENLLDSLTGK